MKKGKLVEVGNQSHAISIDVKGRGSTEDADEASSRMETLTGVQSWPVLVNAIWQN